MKKKKKKERNKKKKETERKQKGKTENRAEQRRDQSVVGILSFLGVWHVPPPLSFFVVIHRICPFR